MALLDKFNRFANQFSDLLGDIADDVRAHVELGAQLLERGDYDAAMRELRHALDKRRDHARAHYLLGLCYLRRGQPGDLTAAKKALSDALAARGDYPEAFVTLGDILAQAGELGPATDAYRQALPLLDDELARAEVERTLGTLYLQLGQLDKAVRELRKSVSSNPDDAKTQGLLGQALVLLMQKRGEAPGSPTWDAARQCLVKAARADKADPQVLTTLGKLLLSSGTDSRCGKSAPAGAQRQSRARRYAAAAWRATACPRGHRVGVRTRSACVRERSTGQARCRAVRCAPAARALSCQERSPRASRRRPCRSRASPSRRCQRGQDPAPVGSHCTVAAQRPVARSACACPASSWPICRWRGSPRASTKRCPLPKPTACLPKPPPKPMASSFDSPKLR